MKSVLIVMVMLATGAVGALAIEPVLPDGARTWIDARQQYINRLEETVVDVSGDIPIASLTIKNISPKTELDCIITGCKSGPLDERTAGVMTFTVGVVPGTASAEVTYSVYLIGLDGYIHAEVNVRWTGEELTVVDSSERSRTKQQEAEMRASRTLKLGISYDDSSIVGVIKEYNERFESELTKYSATIVKECDITLEGATPHMGNPQCLDRDIERYELVDLEIAEIVGNHFNVGIIRGTAFYERRDPDRQRYLTGF